VVRTNALVLFNCKGYVMKNSFLKVILGILKCHFFLIMALVSHHSYAQIFTHEHEKNNKQTPIIIALAQTEKTQDINHLKNKIHAFLTMQTVGYPGKVNINVGNIDKRLKLPACDDVNTNMARGSRAWGNANVSVSCQSPRWSIYVQVEINVMSDYLVAAMPLAQGKMLASQDVIFQKGDLTRLPAGIFTDISQVEGKVVSHSMIAGTVLRQEMLKESPVIQQGQSVMLTTQGQGFSISAEGKAMTKATEGQVVQVKTGNGQVVSGIARQDGKVDVMY
jgi:flagellar basal body P-ring formation protein FlgA